MATNLSNSDSYFKMQVVRPPLEGSPQATSEASSSPVDIQQGESVLVGDGLRQTAARVLLAFLGAANGSQYSVNVFLEELTRCYRSPPTPPSPSSWALST